MKICEEVIVEGNLMGDGVMVNLTNITFTTDCIGTPYILFWLNREQAIQLATHIFAVTQDQEVTKAQKEVVYGKS